MSVGYPRTILVGVDGTRHAEDAAGFAGRLAAASGGRLIVGSVYRFSTLSGRLGSGERAQTQARDALRRAAYHDTQDRIIPATSPAVGLRELALAGHADLIVLGSRHRGRLGEGLPGRVARRLLRTAPCPVAIVGPGRAASEISHVGALTEGGPRDARTVAVAAALAGGTGARLRIYAHSHRLPAVPPSPAHRALLDVHGAWMTADSATLADDLADDRLDLLVVPAWPHGLRGRLRRRGRRLPTGECTLVVVPAGTGVAARGHVPADVARAA